MAPNGTVFLDEVGGEHALRVAAALPRDRRDSAHRLTAHTRVNVRLITATNRDARLKSSPARCEDLLPIERHSLGDSVLRERTDDIPILVQHFLEICAASIGPTCRK